MIESLICLHREVSCIKVIKFSFESGTCLDNKCLINLPIFFLWLRIFLMEGVYYWKGGRRTAGEQDFYFGGGLLLGAYQGRNCFIMHRRIICLLESLEQYCAWTAGDASVPLEWKGSATADSSPLCAAMLEKGFGIRKGLALCSIRSLQKECWQTQMVETRSLNNYSRSW